jgi:hypothetical protein
MRCWIRCSIINFRSGWSAGWSAKNKKGWESGGDSR